MDEIQNLKESFERDGDWAEWSAWAIIGGLVLEVCLLLWYSKDRSSFETLSLVAANGIIAAGVFGVDGASQKPLRGCNKFRTKKSLKQPRRQRKPIARE